MSINLHDIYGDMIPEWRLHEIKQKQEQIDEEFDFQLFCTGEMNA